MYHPDELSTLCRSGSETAVFSAINRLTAFIDLTGATIGDVRPLSVARRQLDFLIASTVRFGVVEPLTPLGTVTVAYNQWFYDLKAQIPIVA